MPEGFNYKLIYLIAILSEVRNISDERGRMYLAGVAHQQDVSTTLVSLAALNMTEGPAHPPLCHFDPRVIHVWRETID